MSQRSQATDESNRKNKKPVFRVTGGGGTIEAFTKKQKPDQFLEQASQYQAFTRTYMAVFRRNTYEDRLNPKQHYAKFRFERKTSFMHLFSVINAIHVNRCFRRDQGLVVTEMVPVPEMVLGSVWGCNH